MKQKNKHAGKLDELALSDVIGDVGSTALKKITGQAQGQTIQQKMAQDMFLKDFIGKAYSSLDTAVKSGLVDVNLQPNSQVVNPKNVIPTQTTTQTTTLQKRTNQTPNSNQKNIQNVNNYVRNISTQLNKVQDKNQKINLTKQLVNFMADYKNTPEWNNAIKTVELVLKKNNDPNFATTAIQNLRQGKKIDLPAKISEAWQIYYFNTLIESVGLTWEDLGFSVVNSNKKFKIIETKYLKLNNVFEQILNEAESITQYLQRFFKQYMHDVNIIPYKADIDKIINNVQTTYSKDKGKKALNQLANVAWAISQVSSAADDEQPTAPPATAIPTQKPSVAQTSTAMVNTSPNLQNAQNIVMQMNNNELSKLIITGLNKLKSNDSTLYSKIIKKIATGVSKPGFADRTAGKRNIQPTTKPITQPTPVTTESKKNKK